jgi:uncharacterized protein YjiS (DUF1127 family)
MDAALCEEGHVEAMAASLSNGAIAMRPTQDFVLPLGLGNTMASAGNAILQLAIRLVDALARWQRNQQAMAALAAMSDRDLKDVGVHRSDIYWAVNHGRQDRPGSMRGKGGPGRAPNLLSARPQTTCERPQPVKVKVRGRVA